MLNKGKVVFLMALACVMLMASGAFAGFGSTDLGAREQLGDTVFFSYYDIRTMGQGGPGLATNYFTIVNTDDDEYVQGHLRVRTGECSVELLDFDVIMSPNDVFTFDLKQNGAGETVFSSCDEETLTHSGFTVDSDGCIMIEYDGTNSELLDECGRCPDGAPMDSEEILEATRWGYVEFIGEAEMCPDDSCLDLPDSEQDEDCLEALLRDGDHTLWSWDDAGCDYDEVDRDLFGRVYYASLDGTGDVIKLATTNGLSDVAVDSVILHRPCYSDNNEGCGSGDGELEANRADGFAYSEATTDGDPDGANDLNYCYFGTLDDPDTAETNEEDTNLLGAAATFGPTIADYRRVGDRDGDWDTTANILYNINNAAAKQDAVSHIWNLNEGDQTRFIFTFPIQHFLAQTIEVSKVVRFDTAENECRIDKPRTKFISPGLPEAERPPFLAGEVSIVNAHDPSDECDDIEGWEEFNVSVVEDGLEPYDQRGYPYSPLVTGEIANWGTDRAANAIAISPMQWKQSID